MRLMKVWLLFAMALVMTSGLASAQSTNGAISGRVVDQTDLPLPGVTVTVEGPNLQGPRSAVTSANGDYIVPLLPPGSYTVTFELSGFQRKQNTVTLAPAQSLPRECDPRCRGHLGNRGGRGHGDREPARRQRDRHAHQPGRHVEPGGDARHHVHHDHGAGRAPDRAERQLLDRRRHVVREPVPGQRRHRQREPARPGAANLFIEDAIQETTVATGGISAEFGRFGGGVVNVDHQVGRQRLQRLVPRDAQQRRLARAACRSATGDPFANDTKVDKTVPTYEYTVGGPDRSRSPVVLHRRPPAEAGAEPPAGHHQHPVHLHRTSRSASSSRAPTRSTEPPGPGRLHEGQRGAAEQHVQHRSLDGPEQPRGPRSCPRISSPSTTPASSRRRFFVEGRYSARTSPSMGAAPSSPTSIKGTLLVEQSGRALLVRHLLRRLRRRRSATTRTSSSRPTTSCRRASTGSHALMFGYDNFNDKRWPTTTSPAATTAFVNANAIVQGTNLTPAVPQRHDADPVEPDLRRKRGVELQDAIVLPERQLARHRSGDREPGRPVGQERRRRQRRHSDCRRGRRSARASASCWTPRERASGR